MAVLLCLCLVAGEAPPARGESASLRRHFSFATEAFSLRADFFQRIINGMQDARIKRSATGPLPDSFAMHAIRREDLEKDPQALEYYVRHQAPWKETRRYIGLYVLAPTLIINTILAVVLLSSPQGHHTYSFIHGLVMLGGTAVFGFFFKWLSAMAFMIDHKKGIYRFILDSKNQPGRIVPVEMNKEIQAKLYKHGMSSAWKALWPAMFSLPLALWLPLIRFAPVVIVLSGYAIGFLYSLYDHSKWNNTPYLGTPEEKADFEKEGSYLLALPRKQPSPEEIARRIPVIQSINIVSPAFGEVIQDEKGVVSLEFTVTVNKEFSGSLLDAISNIIIRCSRVPMRGAMIKWGASPDIPIAEVFEKSAIPTDSGKIYTFTGIFPVFPSLQISFKIGIARSSAPKKFLWSNASDPGGEWLLSFFHPNFSEPTFIKKLLEDFHLRYEWYFPEWIGQASEEMNHSHVMSSALDLTWRKPFDDAYKFYLRMSEFLAKRQRPAEATQLPDFLALWRKALALEKPFDETFHDAQERIFIRAAQSNQLLKKELGELLRDMISQRKTQKMALSDLFPGLGLMIMAIPAGSVVAEEHDPEESIEKRVVYLFEILRVMDPLRLESRRRTALESA